jgi:hypothetical protein
MFFNPTLNNFTSLSKGLGRATIWSVSNTFYRLLLLSITAIFLLLIFASKGYSFHLLGSHITYRVISYTPGIEVRYEITAIQVRDCDDERNPPFELTPKAIIQRTGREIRPQLRPTLYLVGTEQEKKITAKSACNQSSYCYKELIYKGEWIRRNNDADENYRLLSSVRDIEDHMVNIENPASNLLCAWTEISPTLPGSIGINNPNMIAFCFGENNVVTQNMGVTLPNGCQARYSIFSTAQDYDNQGGFFIPVTYKNQPNLVFSATDALGPYADITINGNTGELRITPERTLPQIRIQAGHFIVTIRIIVSRNGRTIATLYRNISLQGFSCYDFQDIKASELLVHPYVANYLVAPNTLDLGGNSISIGKNLNIDTDINVKNGIINFSSAFVSIHPIIPLILR